MCTHTAGGLTGTGAAGFWVVRAAWRVVEERTHGEWSTGESCGFP